MKTALVKHHQFVSGLIAFAAMAVVLFISRHASAVSEENLRRVPYCEAIHDGLFAQPINTLTNLAYPIAALWMLWSLDRSRARRSRSERDYATLYAFVVMFLGAASTAFHGTMSWWAGVVDDVSMNLFATFWLLHAVARRRAWSTATFGAVYAAANLACLVLLLRDDHYGAVLFAILIGVALVVEIASGITVPFMCSAALFGGAIAVWLPSKTGGALCSPETVWQGHGLWHLMTAGAMFTMFFHLRERTASRFATGGILVTGT